MSFYEFKKSDSLFNVIKAHPQSEFYIYNSSVFYQNKNAISGAFVSNLFGIPTGFTPLTELNVDRQINSNSNITIGPSSSLEPERNVVNNGTIYPFLIKNNGNSFKTTSDEQYAVTVAGAIMTSSYALSSSISRVFVPSSYNSSYQSYNSTQVIPLPADPNSINTYRQSISSSLLNSIYNSINEYTIYSPHFAISSSIYNWNKYDQNVNFIQIPGVFFGSKIKKGTVVLDYYASGSLLARLTDSGENGVLVQQSGAISSNDGKVAGVVMYKHGFILLTGSWDLDHRNIDYDVTDKSKWIYWGVGANDGIPADALGGTTRQLVSFKISFEGTNKIPNYTYFATAPKGDLNWSNNPTYLARSGYNITGSGFSSGSHLVTQSPRTIYNVVSSSIDNYSASFQNTTYINHVNLYDEYGNLIAIAKTSKPIKKTEDTDFTFKLKLDM